MHPAATVCCPFGRAATAAFAGPKQLHSDASYTVKQRFLRNTTPTAPTSFKERSRSRSLPKLRQSHRNGIWPWTWPLTTPRSSTTRPTTSFFPFPGPVSSGPSTGPRREVRRRPQQLGCKLLVLLDRADHVRNHGSTSGWRLNRGDPTLRSSNEGTSPCLLVVPRQYDQITGSFLEQSNPENKHKEARSSPI